MQKTRDPVEIIARSVLALRGHIAAYLMVMLTSEGTFGRPHWPDHQFRKASALPHALISMDENHDPNASEALNHNASTWIPPQFDVRVAPRPAFSAPVGPEEASLNFYRAAKWYVLGIY